jgi:hypothetical protein
MATPNIEQYLQERHIPVVQYQGQGAAQSEQLPDWLNARYADIWQAELETQVHIVSDTDLGQPDAIAYRYYGNSNWWWLICSYNGVVNPLTDMFLGQRLKIPALQQAQLLLQELDGRREDRIGTTVIL